MSNPRMSSQDSKSAIKPSQDTLKRVRFNSDHSLEVEDCITGNRYANFSTTFQMKRLPLGVPECAMQESVPPIKELTLSDKFNFYKRGVHHVEFSKMLDRVSTTNEKALKPFWNSYTAEASLRLPSCTKTVCVDMDLKSYNGFVTSTMSRSWFKVEAKRLQSTASASSPTTSLAWLTSLLQSVTDAEVLRIESSAKEKRDHISPIKSSLRAKKIYPKSDEELMKNGLELPKFVTKKIKLLRRSLLYGIGMVLFVGLTTNACPHSITDTLGHPGTKSKLM